MRRAAKYGETLHSIMHSLACAWVGVATVCSISTTSPAQIVPVDRARRDAARVAPC
jgi:hypothetical protein